MRAGAIVAAATLVLNLSAYFFNVACIRYLGSRLYGDVAAMLALGAIVALPLGGIQVVLAREVAQLVDPGTAGRLLRRVATGATVIGVGLLGLGLALLVPIQDLLNIADRETVVAGLSGITLSILAAGLFGVLQGKQRFGWLGAAYGVSGISRVVLVVPALLLGFGAAGALAVTTIAGAFAVALAAFALRDVWRVHESAIAPHFDSREVLVMFAGWLAFASLTNADIILASYFLTDDEAGVYAAAALVGKAVLYLPAAIVMVLLPKASVRAAAGLSPHKILFASAAVTMLVTLSVTAVLAVVPESLLVWAFGGDFRDSTDLLGWFGLAMSAAALVVVYLSVYFAERNARFPLVVLGAAVAQIVLVSLFHADALSIVLATLACATAVLVVHELFFPYAIVRVVRARRRALQAERDSPSGPLLPD